MLQQFLTLLLSIHAVDTIPKNCYANYNFEARNCNQSETGGSALPL